jgi:hypothetical protein
MLLSNIAGIVGGSALNFDREAEDDIEFVDSEEESEEEEDRESENCEATREYREVGNEEEEEDANENEEDDRGERERWKREGRGSSTPLNWQHPHHNTNTSPTEITINMPQKTSSNNDYSP